MILNGHGMCSAGYSLDSIFQRFYRTATDENMKSCAKSLLFHTWTFDDALIDQFRIYLEHFANQEKIFHLFVCPKLIDEWELGNINYVRGQLRNSQAELMGWDAVCKLAEYGVIIGSHGIDHSSFSTMSVEQCYQQYEHSKNMISARTGRKVNTFAFPFGRVAPSSVTAALEARKFYKEVYLSDNSLAIGELADGVFNRRHAEYGICAGRGILVGALDILLGARRWRSS